MKKVLSIVLAAALFCLALAGCGASGKDFTPGKRTETEYVSEWMGVRYTLGDGMVMATDEEIEAAMGVGSELMYGEDGEEKLRYAQITTIYDMLAADISSGSNIIVMAEKLPLSNMTEEDYLEALQRQVTQANVSLTDVQEATMEICGETYYTLEYTIAAGGVSTLQTILVRKIGDRMAAISLTYQDAGARDALLAGFSALK